MTLTDEQMLNWTL